MLLFTRLGRAVTEWQWAYPGLAVPPLRAATFDLLVLEFPCPSRGSCR